RQAGRDRQGEVAQARSRQEVTVSANGRRQPAGGRANPDHQPADAGRSPSSGLHIPNPTPRRPERSPNGVTLTSPHQLPRFGCSMPPDRVALLDRILGFDIDGVESPALPFAARLARENGWSRPHAERVIREYRRFVFLAVTAGFPVCPSEDVDAAWHL